jgi:hypothetical protein
VVGRAGFKSSPRCRLVALELVSTLSTLSSALYLAERAGFEPATRLLTL